MQQVQCSLCLTLYKECLCAPGLAQRTVAFSVPLLLQPLLVCWVCIGEMLCGHLFCWLVKHTRAGHLRVEVADGASGEVCRQRQVGCGGGG